MRTRQRLLALKKWTYETVCKGRVMKTPGRDKEGNEDITVIARQEPVVYLGWQPTRPDITGDLQIDPTNVCPGILIAPSLSNVHYVEERRFDRYSNVHRPQELGQWLNVSVLFSVYEPGIRLPGFVESASSRSGLDISTFKDGTEEGLFTLMDWIDDFHESLLAVKSIPGSDLYVDETSITYSPYTESGFIVDKRPIYYGFVNVKFQCYSNEKNNSKINELLL